jgi:hypothetical protein
MLSAISLIFIIFIVLLSTVVMFTRVPVNEHFNLPVQKAANVPAMLHTEGKNFYVGNKVDEVPDEPIVSSTGKYEFRKMQLLYDGVWGEKCGLDGKGNERCDWEVMSGECPLDKEDLKYGANHFFQEQKRLAMGQKVVSPPDCPITSKMYYKGPTYLENQMENPPIYLEQPSAEDILGFPPQDNELYWDKPGVILGTL